MFCGRLMIERSEIVIVDNKGEEKMRPKVKIFYLDLWFGSIGE